MPAEAGGAGPAPAAGPGSGNGGSKGPLASAPPAQSGRCCRPGAWARPWVPAEPESRGGLNLGRGAGPPAHRPAGLGQCGSSRRLAPPGWLCPGVQGRQRPSSLPSMDLPRGDASQRKRQGLGRRDLHDSLDPGGWEPLGVTVSRQGPALQSHSQSCLGPTLELEPAQPPAHTLEAGNSTLTGEGHRPFALKTGRPGCPLRMGLQSNTGVLGPVQREASITDTPAC